MADPPLSPNGWLRYDAVKRQLREIGPVEAIVEVGAGGGSLGARLAATAPYTAVEPDEQSRSLARSRLPPGTTVVSDLADVGPTRFGLLCAFEVLEHIEDDRDALASWCEVLAPGGWVLVSVPAHRHHFAAADRLVGHQRRYDPDDLQALLRDVGLGEIRIGGYGFPLGNVLEAGRNFVASRRDVDSASPSERTAASGRLWQPADRLAPVTRAATYPFRLVQRRFGHPRWGRGLIARARR